MDQQLQRVLSTKNTLRKQSLSTILDQFDGQLMNLSQSSRKKKYDKMRQDAYSFFRGSAYLFFFDVIDYPFTFHTPDDKPTWIMGDMHFDNFSAFQNESHDIVFDVDDFDEGYLGSYLYDVLRMIVSIRLTANQGDFTKEEQDELVDRYLKTYVKQLEAFQQGEDDPRSLEFTIENTKKPIKKVLKKVEKRKASHELDKQTVIDHDSIRSFDIGKDKLSSVSKQERDELSYAWKEYIASLDPHALKEETYYRIKDVVKKKGAGIGSTGLQRYYILIEGEADETHHDDIILEAKEARTPIPAYFFTYDEKFWEDNKHQGRRVAHTQRAMHHKADTYLGYFSMNGRDFYVRERSPFTKDLKEKDVEDFKSMNRAVKTMAKISAKIHARADADLEEGILDYHSEDAILEAIGSKKKLFRHQLSLWSDHYQDIVERDFELFKEWLSEQEFFKS
ncbi:DUF2252 domain-containing protein [Halobacillus sp. BBL2006]|uniref:DUF2252 domain-containing protein n=1 Tax=Halobacillus sp. BBL2006 TaxID=1543706 RepID=UPI000542AF4B|nr:DUF2252 family protein [Halobacillus sp. BBL2006]KHE73285.1 hypothetical protein LD39_00060 [Halobacillus sp. BBL2006]